MRQMLLDCKKTFFAAQSESRDQEVNFVLQMRHNHTLRSRMEAIELSESLAKSKGLQQKSGEAKVKNAARSVFQFRIGIRKGQFGMPGFGLCGLCNVAWC
jgi:hypothetical protein